MPRIARNKPKSPQREKTPEQSRLQVWSRTERSQSTGDFKIEAIDIVREYGSRNETADKLSPFNSAEGYLKRECYFLIKKFMTDNSASIKKLSCYSSRTAKQPSYTDNQFYWGLLAIDPAYAAIKERNLILYSRQLLYAHRHNVSSEFLVGFIYQSGSPRSLRVKLDQRKREEEFELVQSRERSANRFGKVWMGG